MCVAGITKEDLWPPHVEEDDMNIMNAKLFPVAHTDRTPSLADILWLANTDSTDRTLLQPWRSSWRLSLAEVSKATRTCTKGKFGCLTALSQTILCLAIKHRHFQLLFSFSQVLSLVDYEEEFAWRNELFFSVGEARAKQILTEGESLGLSKFFGNAVVEAYHARVLEALDEIAATCSSPGIAARTLASIADVLGHLAGGKGGMRSGPAGNKQWKLGFDELERGNIADGVRALARERGNWLGRPEHLVRAARHYEGAAQILIRHAVMTARTFVSLSEGSPAPMNCWVVAECPARLDLSGGWSDTPPITYEHGGAVVTVAIQVDDKKPIGAKVRRIPDQHLQLHVGSGFAKSVLILKEIEDLADYNQPHAPGALLKAALYCAKVVDPDSALHTQLKEKYDGGFEMAVWSNLPQGSGLGTSSILAGALLAALWRCIGKQYTLKDLIHAVLHLEQMLTTGGGWQDQVGGLVGGLTLGTSGVGLPLLVNFKRLAVSSSVIARLNKQLFLVYTGKTRLARDLLQNVIRQWYARLPGIVATEDDLVKGAHVCVSAVEHGDLPALGKCMENYWAQKKRMAPGCEPAIVASMRVALESYALGITMAGAGGGGFLYILLKPEFSVDTLRDVLSGVEGAQHVTIHRALVDESGLTVRLTDEVDNMETC